MHIDPIQQIPFVPAINQGKYPIPPHDKNIPSIEIYRQIFEKNENRQQCKNKKVLAFEKESHKILNENHKIIGISPNLEDCSQQSCTKEYEELFPFSEVDEWVFKNIENDIL